MTNKPKFQSKLALLFSSLIVLILLYLYLTTLKRPGDGTQISPETIPTPSATITSQPSEVRYTSIELNGVKVSDGYSYRNRDLGIEFVLPKQMGLTKLGVGIVEYPSNLVYLCLTSEASMPNNYTLCRSVNSFAINAVITNGVTESGPDFEVIQKYDTKNGKYYCVYGDAKDKNCLIGAYPGNQNINISSNNITELKNPQGINILRIVGDEAYSDLLQHTISYAGVPKKGYIGAIVNLPNNPNYSGFTIQIKLSDNLTEKVFDQILDSIKIVK